MSDLIPRSLLDDVLALIERSRTRVAASVNSELVMLYWGIGQRLLEHTLGFERAEYGAQVIDQLAQQLTASHGRGFSRPNLFRAVQFAETYPDGEIVSTLSRQLSWSHFLELLPLRDPLQREFYAEMARVERWSVRTLRQKIGGLLYERTALAKKPDALIEQELDDLRTTGKMTPDLVFRDPYLLDFLNLEAGHSERDLEDAILHDLERFLLELGSGFAFVERQKRISVGNDDYYLDLLFYHRRLRRLVAIELKLEKFQAAHKGQMELYLRWLERFERAPGEDAPIGLILCSSAEAEHVELLDLERDNIRVAQYITELPPVELLQARLHQAIERARARQLPASEGDPPLQP